jgi:hypothetical protein
MSNKNYVAVAGYPSSVSASAEALLAHDTKCLAHPVDRASGRNGTQLALLHGGLLKAQLQVMQRIKVETR